MQPKAIFILLFIWSCCSYDSYCQRLWLVSGRVAEANGRPLPFALVVLADSKGVAAAISPTDSNGHFSLLYKTGSYKLVVSHSGYKTYSSTLFEIKDSLFSEIRLSAAGALEAVVIESNQKQIEAEGGSIIYNVAKSVDAQGLSVFDVLKKAPGVHVEQETNISLNGRQGVQVLLDGKSTYLSGKELVDLLRSMPSSGIKSIELIGSPTAKYDASGSAGIINIRTTKSGIKGLTGTVTAGLAYGINLRQNTDASFNYRKDRLNFFGSYNHFIGHATYAYGTDRLQRGQAINSFTDDTDKRNKLGARLGLDYNLDKEHTIGVLLNSNFVLGGGITRTKTNLFQPASPTRQQVLDSENDYYFQETDRYNLNLNYKYEDAGGRQLNVDMDQGYFKKGNANLQSNIYSENANLLSSSLYRIINDIGIKLKAAKLDYTTPLWSGILEAGVKLSDVKAANDSKFLHATVRYDSLDDRRSNHFNFDESISSGYLNYKSAAGKWSWQLGLRIEHSASRGQLVFSHKGKDSTENISRKFLHLFPAFSISAKPGESHSFSLAYSRRIDRPAYQDLNPFVYLLDELSYWQGNPFLQPQLTHRLTMQYVYKSATIAGLSFSHTEQFSTRITDTVDLNKIVMVQRNLGVQQNIALSLVQNFSATKWWNVSFNGNFYHLHNKIAFDEYRNFNLRQLAARFSLLQTFKISGSLTGELTASYNSRRLSGANDIAKAISTVDIGFQRKMLNNKATLRLVVNDIYKGSPSRSIQNYNGFYLRSYGYYETRQLRLNFSYRFAGSTIKDPRVRNSALEAESSRIK